ncbi:uncharacterized protein MKK02DRAFT_31324 [Dioszegia hungarica]|uniref:Uncharacterized protein n=1 Tax=Dioszegia hungarica TaxID=4972 RepID=A0AA38HCA8_9TREE|nr:uncharacterized protein MKK02DRAFT_31324 [Dioszegia hungarica]KAI9637745.1 hypothetical protein MKK02DRAFT_31324 [Dioszegia hungarica]
MATVATIFPSHPAAMTLVYPTPPTTPTSPTFFHPAKRSASTLSSPIAAKTPTQTFQIQSPAPNYALLRSHHVSAIKYIIAKVRWQQANNSYLPGESAWQEHNAMIKRLEDELKAVEAAQKDLDRFPTFCHAPVAPLETKPYGPQTKEQVEKAQAEAERKDKEMDREIEKQFPFIKQLFIGPRTKQQARNDRQLRKNLKAGDLMDITELLPSENLRAAMAAAGQGEKKAEKRRPYHEVRMEREKAKVKAILEEEEARMAKLPAVEKPARIGPITKEEHMASLPVFGPPTLGEALLPIQREQRHIILNFLRKPWQQYDEEAAPLLERLGRFAVKRLNQDKDKEAKQE